MTFNDAILIAYADGELSLVERKRIEQAMATDPALAGRVAAHTALSDRLRDAFAPIAQAPVPDRLTSMLTAKVVRLDRTPKPRRWLTGLALAASLVLGVGLGTLWNGGARLPVGVRGGTLVAAGPLAHALDTQLASTSGDMRILVSFRGADGYCRVFASPATDGIACRSGDAWQLRQTRSGRTAIANDYRQAASADPALMAAAQDMMNGEPLDQAAERGARAAGWR